jgi:hypothetical protein
MVLKTKQWEYLSKCWHLTPREVEVAKLVCEGMDNEQIGKKLRIAYNTVRAHLGNIISQGWGEGQGRYYPGIHQNDTESGNLGRRSYETLAQSDTIQKEKEANRS